MADYYGTTVCEGGKIKKGKNKEVEAVIAKYDFGDLTAEVVDNEIQVYGEEATQAYHVDDEDRDTDVFDEFLEEVMPYLAENFIVKEVGNEKCRYANAYAYIAIPTKGEKGEVVCVSLDGAIEQALKW